MSRRVPVSAGFLAILALSISVLLPSDATGASCPVVQITTSLWQGQPTCGTPGDITVKVVVTISGGCSASQTFYKCGAATDSYQFSACGKTHTVSLTSGNWEDAMADCSGIAYSAH